MRNGPLDIVLYWNYYDDDKPTTTKITLKTTKTLKWRSNLSLNFVCIIVIVSLFALIFISLLLSLFAKPETEKKPN